MLEANLTWAWALWLVACCQQYDSGDISYRLPSSMTPIPTPRGHISYAALNVHMQVVTGQPSVVGQIMQKIWPLVIAADGLRLYRVDQIKQHFIGT